MKEYEQIVKNIMMTALEGVKAQIRKAYDKGYKDGKADTPFTDTEEAENKAYSRGLNDAWEVATKVRLVFKRNTASEAIAKIKEYEDKQKQDAEIKVGDEIVCEDAYVVVTYVSPIGEWNGFLLKESDCGKQGQGYTCMNSFKGWRKTGRHFPQIAEVLAEMRGAE